MSYFWCRALRTTAGLGPFAFGLARDLLGEYRGAILLAASCTASWALLLAATRALDAGLLGGLRARNAELEAKLERGRGAVGTRSSSYFGGRR